MAKNPFTPLQVVGKGGAATPADVNRVQDQVRQAFDKLKTGGVTKVTSKDGSVVLTPKTGNGSVDLSVPAPFDTDVVGATTLVPPANAPDDLVSTTAALYLEVTVDGTRYVTPLWQRKPTSPSFTPPAGCKIWLDAANAGTVHQSGSVVTQWDDALGSGFDLDVQVGNPGTATVNGLTAIATSSGNKLQRAASLMSGGAARDIYVVAKPTTNAGDLLVGMGSDTGGFSVGWENIGGTNRYFFVQWFGPDAYFNDGGHDYSNEVHIFRYSWPATASNQVTCELDGASVGTPTWDGTMTTSDGAALFGIGGFANANNGRDWAGAICEVLIFDHVLSSGDDTTVRNHLKPKWGTP